MDTLATIRAAFEAEVEALIKRYPAQRANRAHYAEKAASLKLGRLTRRVRTKLHDFPRGTIVGYYAHGPDDDSCYDRHGLEPVPGASIYAPGISDGAMFTIVPVSEIAPVCSTCDGTGHVLPHPTALVAVNCPAC